ncbi:DNA repair protein [Lindgomyces ingoldianus]|uniref:DNA repair protein n=1 Tax=Lindgomyces ingoldianus TaxID=673940 RepID=A0ACB6RGQ6_9PLEO|nr:DNA repair protein [Lindgomyces ingoldianus]KAF2478301.1 DNA repair protein [Lindgomyces ingoldianus]
MYNWRERKLCTSRVGVCKGLSAQKAKQKTENEDGGQLEIQNLRQDFSRKAVDRAWAAAHRPPVLDSPGRKTTRRHSLISPPTCGSLPAPSQHDNPSGAPPTTPAEHAPSLKATMGSRLESNSSAVRKRISNHSFEDEDGDEYEGSKFGGFSDYFRRKKIKLQNLDADLRSQSVDKPAIFKGIVAHVNGYTQPSLNDLHTLIVQHGGGFMQYLDGKTTVTHIIASSLTPKKVVEFRRYRIVKPGWVVASIKAGRLLPWNDYRVVDEGDSQRVLAFDNGKVFSKANVKARGYRDQTDTSWYTSQLRGSQAESPSPPPSSTMPSRFSMQRSPMSHGGIEELPPSHQPEMESRDTSVLDSGPDNVSKPRKLVAPPKTSPSLGSQVHHEENVNSKYLIADQDDSLYADPTPPDAPQARPRSVSPVKRPVEDGDEEPVEPPPKKTKLTAEEHNAILLRDPKIRKSTVVDPNFLEQYYRESRLHHLSTWKADLKSQLQALANERTSSQQRKHKRPPGARRYVLHVDFDSFFASVSLKKNPQYKDKPAVVAHGNGNGSEIASCNYSARKFGVKNGMWMKRAMELCPDLKILPYDFPAYEEASRAFYDAILATGGLVQSVSIDEALIDVSSLCAATGGSDGRNVSEGSVYREQAKADEIAQSLRNQVKEKTDCNVSVGIGGNILLAKVALRKAKPAGQHQIKHEEILDFIGQLQVQDLPGVAWSIGGKLEEMGIKFVKDIREFPKERLIQTLGPKTGEKLWEYSRGIDRTEVGEQVVRKSVSAEVSWGVRFENQDQADEFIGSLCGELQKRLIKEKVKGKQFTMKIMRRSPDAPLDPPKHLGHGKCDTYNKSMVLGVATNAKDVLTKEALSILKGFGFSPGELRGIGVQMTKLEHIKSTIDGQFESSQRRLQFKVNVNAETTSTRKAPKIADADPIQDDPETPRKPKAVGRADADHISFGAQQLNHSTPSRRPLNTLGTQFILPTQADPKVLAELPEDIRSKLLRQVRQSSPTPAPRNPPAPPAAHKSCESLPHVPKGKSKEHEDRDRIPLTALPAHSQLDPYILAALPADVRAEVLAQYADSATPSTIPLTIPSSPHDRKPDQTLLPQSPRKSRIIGIPTKKPNSGLPVKRGRGRPPKSAQLAAAAAASVRSKSGKIVDTAEHSGGGGRSGSGGGGVEELDPDFLSALPEDLRREVVEEHRRKKLQASRLAVTIARKQKEAALPPVVKRPQRIKIPRPPKPTFTTRRLWDVVDLRTAIRDWVREFSDEGPYGEDVEALGRYLGRVVGEERDLGKAVGVVRWLIWVVGEVDDEGSGDREGNGGFEKNKWDDAVQRVKEGVREAGRRRGLGNEWC